MLVYSGIYGTQHHALENPCVWMDTDTHGSIPILRACAAGPRRLHAQKLCARSFCQTGTPFLMSMPGQSALPAGGAFLTMSIRMCRMESTLKKTPLGSLLNKKKNVDLFC